MIMNLDKSEDDSDHDSTGRESPSGEAGGDNCQVFYPYVLYFIHVSITVYKRNQRVRLSVCILGYGFKTTSETSKNSKQKNPNKQQGKTETEIKEKT